jgi:hypothetical protein
VQDAARRHGVVFVQFPTFWSALAHHFRHITRVNDSPVHGGKGAEFVRERRPVATLLGER